MSKSESYYIDDDYIDKQLDNDSVNLKTVKKFERIHSLNIDSKQTKWFVKTYKDTDHAKREFENLSILKDIQGVPKVVSVWFSDTVNYLLITKFTGKDLFDHVLTNKKVFNEKQTKQIAKNILKILYNIHKNNIVHGDIKPENIIYDEVCEKINIIDFEEKYTEEYRSPEHVKSKNISFKTDLWSLGVSLFFISSGKLPFKNKAEILHKTIKYPSFFSSQYIDFLENLLERDPHFRYDTRKALRHKWITSL